MASEKYELALGDVKGHVLQGQRTVGIGFVYVGETDHGVELRGSAGLGLGLILARRRSTLDLEPGRSTYFNPCSRSAMTSSATSIPQLNGKNPSGLRRLARPSRRMLLCAPSRGSGPRVSTPARLGA